MPVYTYRCENCGVQFDRMQKFTEEPLKRCPECGKSTLRKVYTPVGIVFKGSGFYATDHRSPSGQTKWSDKAGDKSADSKSSSSSDGGSADQGSSSSSATSSGESS
jgi:putative FmdB family regulatory protein